MHSIEPDSEVAAQPDRAGIIASTLCAVHCGLSTVIVGSTGFGGFLASESLERAFFSVTVLIALFALVRGLRRHGRRTPLLVAAVALVPLCFARFVAWPEHVVEAGLSIAGAMGLITAHTLNLQHDREACGC